MAKKNRHRKGGQVTPRGTRPASFDPEGGWPQSGADGGARQELFDELDAALADPHPMSLLCFVSSMLRFADPREHRGIESRRPKPEEQLTVGELVNSFVQVNQPESTALLAAMAPMVSDDLTTARIRRELAQRSHPLPSSLTSVDGAAVHRAVELVHVLGDGDNLLLGVRFPGGTEMTVVVYIDHNLGTVVKDAFVMPQGLDEAIALMKRFQADPDTTWRDVPLGDARVRTTEAVEVSAIMFPPLESDTWPGCRALVEWLVRGMPADGTGYQRPEWSNDALTALTDRFLASPFGAGLDGVAHRKLLDSILRFGTDYGPGDPLRWSPVSVEILLVDWIPRKIVAETRDLAVAPQVLRAFIRFSHYERGIRKALTTETLVAVDRWEPDYQRAIDSPRLQGAAALAERARLWFQDDDDWDDEDDDWDDDWGDDDWDDDLSDFDYATLVLDSLAIAVGGVEALDALDVSPLPEEPLNLDGIEDDIRDTVGAIAGLTDRCCDAIFTAEHRTACRRFLALVARSEPEIFRRRARNETAAVAVCWIIAKANISIGSPPLVYAKDLMAHFGLTGGASRAAGMLRAVGLGAAYAYLPTGLGGEYLTSSRRKTIVERRDHFRSVNASPDASGHHRR